MTLRSHDLTKKVRLSNLDSPTFDKRYSKFKQFAISKIIDPVSNLGFVSTRRRLECQFASVVLANIHFYSL